MPFPFIPLAIAGVSALSGLLNNRKKTTQQQQQSLQNIDRTNTQNYDVRDSPDFLPSQLSGIDLGLGNLSNLARSGTDLSGYTAQGLQNINRTNAMKQKLAQGNLAARGLSYSPLAATSELMGQNDRLSESSNFLNSIPLLQRQMQSEDATNLIRAISAIPTGSRRTGSTVSRDTGTIDTTSTGSATDPGNPWGGLVSGLAGGLAPIAANWAYNKQLEELAKRFPNLGNVTSTPPFVPGGVNDLSKWLTPGYNPFGGRRP